MTLAVTIEAMAAAGCTAEQMAAVAHAVGREEEARRREEEDRTLARRRAGLERQRRYLARKMTPVDASLTVNDGDKESPSSPPSVPPMRDNNSTPLPSPTPKEISREGRAHLRDLTEKFDRFWAVWPNKVGKPKALQSFANIANEVDAIVAGTLRYIEAKPPDCKWLNPATFLNQRRFRIQKSIGCPPKIKEITHERPVPG